MPPFDRVIVSSNEDPLYLDFWPLVAWTYRAMFPGLRVTLAFCSDRRESDPFVAELRQHGEVVLVPTTHDLPIANQAKMARYWVAMQEPETVAYLDDIDLIPLSREWLVSKVAPRPAGHLLFVGHDAYSEDPKGQTPVSQMTGEGRLFRQLVNPDGLALIDWLRSFIGRTGRHEDIASRAHHEGSACPTDQEHLDTLLFSDEALLRSLRLERRVPEHHERRGYVTERDTVDRSCWDATNLDRKVHCHAIRPYGTQRHRIRPVLEYVRDTYHASEWPELAPRLPGITPDMQCGGSGLTREAMQWIFDHIPGGSYILEFGSGHVSTKYLSRFYSMVSVEDRFEYLNLHVAQYIYAPLGGRWYDPKPIRRETNAMIARGERPVLVIVDGPTGDDLRVPEGYAGWLNTYTRVLVDDIDRPNAMYLADQIDANPPFAGATFGVTY